METNGLIAAFVLHSRRYRDNSLILEILSREQGRVSCIARGALGSGRRTAAPQPFSPLAVGLRGRGELPTLASAESTGRAMTLSGTRLFCGLYLNELLLHLTIRHDPCEGLFDDYQATLEALHAGAPQEPVLRRFEVRLLAHLGHGLALDVDSRGQPLLADQRYTYDIEQGPVATAAANNGAVFGRTLSALDHGQFPDDDTLREARTLMRRILHHYLEGRPLRSRELFR